eukprot:880429-Amphidinium_carterae.1
MSVAMVVTAISSATVVTGCGLAPQYVGRCAPCTTLVHVSLLGNLSPCIRANALHSSGCPSVGRKISLGSTGR